MDDDDEGKLMIKEEPTDDESKMDFTESSIDVSAVKKEEDDDDDDIPMVNWFTDLYTYHLSKFCFYLTQLFVSNKTIFVFIFYNKIVEHKVFNNGTL